MVTDVKEGRIPNQLCVAMFAIGIVFRIATGGLAGCLDSLAGFAVGFAILMLLYLIGGGGAGDVKFMGAVGAWLGPYHILFVFVISAVLLLIFTIVVMVGKVVTGNSPTRKDQVSAETVSKTSPFRARIPYAVPATLAIGFRLLWLLLIGRSA